MKVARTVRWERSSIPSGAGLRPNYFYVTDNKEHKELLDKNNSPVQKGEAPPAPNREPSFHWV